MADDTPWEHLRTFEALARHGSLTKAARALGVSQSTVSRHLAQLEERAGSPLLLRETPIALTERGEALLAAIRPMTDAALSAGAALSATPELRGEVTVTTVGEVTRWALVGALPSFYRAYPHLRLRLLASNQIASLAAGEADVALRFARPERGELVGRRLATETYALFAAPGLALGPDTPWLGLAGSLAGIPEQQHAARLFAGRPARLSVEDVESLGLAVRDGLGVAILPRGLAARLALRREVKASRVGAAEVGPIPSRDLWLVVHRSKRDVPKVRAVVDWLTSVLARPALATLETRVVHQGRGGYVEVEGTRYPIEHIEGGAFSVSFPGKNRHRRLAQHLEALEALARAEPGKWAIERRGKR